METGSAEDSRALARVLAVCLRAGDVVGLEGELGTGKTTFTQGIVSALEGGEPSLVNSPSFTLMNLYPTRPPLVHFDFYRLEGLDDLESTGYWDIVGQGDPIVVIEWSDRIPQALDRDAWRVHFEFTGADRRRIEVFAPPHRLDPLEATLRGDDRFWPEE